VYRNIKNRLIGRQRPPLRTQSEEGAAEQPDVSAVRAQRIRVQKPAPGRQPEGEEVPAVRGQAVRGPRPVVRPLAEEAESAVRGQGFRGQRPEQLEEAQLEEKEDEGEGHQPMFKSFPIAGASRHGSAPDRNAEITEEVPRYLPVNFQEKLCI